MAACEEFGVQQCVKETTVRKALLIPQDRPEAICLENLRDFAAGDGLMVNPNPMEFWRKMKLAGGKTKKKGGKKKKK